MACRWPCRQSRRNSAIRRRHHGRRRVGRWLCGRRWRSSVRHADRQHRRQFQQDEIFIDSKAGGENVLTNVPQYDFNNVSQNIGGLTFDTGFTADYHLFGRWGGGGNVFDIDFADRNGGGNCGCGRQHGRRRAAVAWHQSGSVSPGNNGLNNAGNRDLDGFISSPVGFRLQQHQRAAFGRYRRANQAAAAAVTTGFEFSVALADIGNPGSASLIRIQRVRQRRQQLLVEPDSWAALPPPAATWAATAPEDSSGTSPASTSITLPATSTSHSRRAQNRRRSCCSDWRCAGVACGRRR